MTNENIATEVALTPEQIAALEALNGAGETASEEGTIFVTEDTADHVVTVH